MLLILLYLILLLYTIIHILLLYIILYIILYLFSSSDLFPSSPLFLLFSSSIFHSSLSSPLILPPSSPQSIFLFLILIHSILVGTYIRLFIYSSLFFPSPLTLLSSSVLYSPILSHHLFSPLLSLPSFKVYVSVLPYTYLYSRLISQISDPAQTNGVDG